MILSCVQDDYIEPEDEADEDNYIDPTEKTPTGRSCEDVVIDVCVSDDVYCVSTEPSVTHRGVKPCVPARGHSPGQEKTNENSTGVVLSPILVL